MRQGPSLRFEVTAAALAEVLEHAVRAAPAESCGVLLGGAGAARTYVPMRNVAAAPRQAFAFDDGEWLRVARAADAQGLEVVAIAHSHVGSAAEPSATDRALGDAAPWMLIVTVHEGRGEPPRAWCRRGEAWVEAAVTALEAGATRS